MNEEVKVPSSDKIVPKDDKENTLIGTEVFTVNEVKAEIPDGGLQAWTVLFGCFCGIFAIYSINYSWGVFLNHYNAVVFPGELNQLSWIGSICIALYFWIGPVNEWVTRKLGYTRMLPIATIICPLAMMLASISHQIWHLYLTQGVLFGLGASLVWFPCIGAPQQWFSKKRGLAVGITISGCGIGGLIVSNVCQLAIEHLDYRWALRISGFICFFFMVIATFLIKECPAYAAQAPQQCGTAAANRSIVQTQLSLLRNPQFITLLIIGFVTTFGYLVSLTHTVSYANFIGLDAWVGTNLSAIMSAVNAVSMLAIGGISDKLGRINCLFVCTLLSGIFSLSVWTTAHNEAAIWIYVVLYGFFGAGYIILFGAVLPEVAGYENISAANGLLYFTNLFGYLFGTPITSAIITHSDPPNYTGGIVWSGLLMSVGGLFCLLLRIVRGGWNPCIKI
ncbi:hypothetical protein HMPREF1544_10725 [Mucor circinelloides 1006PhL]|uniref:Major facilitator superfamily (MFS) profile domain-containing protein n=1 Tax=Mucor circinelloides f. circinelloides (strain 1006PhL) TaxID=1220926 RepID=S2IXQ2_MUCC1|nr:hypothetical protein HMPREF1544_10725 [Mucor circinelloides 1006PhL]